MLKFQAWKKTAELWRLQSKPADAKSPKQKKHDLPMSTIHLRAALSLRSTRPLLARLIAASGALLRIGPKFERRVLRLDSVMNSSRLLLIVCEQTLRRSESSGQRSSDALSPKREPALRHCSVSTALTQRNTSAKLLTEISGAVKVSTSHQPEHFSGDGNFAKRASPRIIAPDCLKGSMVSLLNGMTRNSPSRAVVVRCAEVQNYRKAGIFSPSTMTMRRVKPKDLCAGFCATNAIPGSASSNRPDLSIAPLAILPNTALSFASKKSPCPRSSK